MQVQESTRLRDVMSRDILSVHPDATLEEASRIFEAAGSGPVPVMDKGRFLGTISDHDVDACHVTDHAGTRVSQVMSPGVVFCYEDQSLSEARDLMEQHHVARVLVLSRDRQLVGEVTEDALEDS